jgi:hypothetical protein
VSGYHEVGLKEPASRRHEPSDERRRDGEWGIGDDPKRAAGEPKVAGVRQHDDDAGGPEAMPEVTGTLVV